ncbi:putative quorum-sensing-regulated virulence factor [Rhabdochlamydiaceae symbiont of Dictyostelium giganteum]|uniref:putative quorum-sensing-regulated virulence factor n=1 Tax=Rhabdochlamydiaceae symbiont of Dictyostelium giganteum TaxID=3342349 RepID=UPI00384F5216
MTLLNEQTFICLDCETTGLDAKSDRIIEIAVTKFTFAKTLATFETLIDPEQPISAASMLIHHIDDSMVAGQPKIQEVLPKIIEMVGPYPVIGHGIQMDLSFLAESCKRYNIPNPFLTLTFIDTLRLARLYGESPTNSLEKLRQHFNIQAEGAHRAMNDVIVNIRVFEYLSKTFKTTEQLLTRLTKPIMLKNMPLGKYKGRPFSELPIDYLSWAMRADFDQDLLFSLRSEFQKRTKGTGFEQASNPFAKL